mgnify:CR=1 FL=1
MKQSISVPARMGALVVFVVALLSLRLQFDASYALRGTSVLATLWGMAGYFTVLTNVLVAGGMGLVAMRWKIPAGLAFAGALAIMMVGLIYHVLLARLNNPVELAWWADQGLHTVVPLLALMWWLAFAPMPEWRALAGGLVWPLVYVVSAMVRGAVTGFWPYPFLDVAQLGWSGVALNLCGMVLAFIAVGAALIAGKRRLG